MPVNLTNQNYHSNEANQQYMSVSLYKNFLSCESMALAKINGWKEPESDVLLLGSYVHAWLEGSEALSKFREEHPEIVSSKGPTKGELKAEYRHADKMIETVEKDDFCMFVLQGEKERIMTAEFAGATWKIKIDVYNPDRGRIADLKTVKGIREKIWDPKYGYVSFVEGYGYVTQMAVYCEIERRATGREGWLEPLIVAVSKEEIPDKEIICLDEKSLQRELELVEHNMKRILAVRNGYEEPKRCEKCRYCRETKRLRRTVHYLELVV